MLLYNIFIDLFIVFSIKHTDGVHSCFQVARIMAALLISHNGAVYGSAFDSFIMMFCVFQVGERIRVILDCDDNTLAFEKNYEFLGKFNRITGF